MRIAVVCPYDLGATGGVQAQVLGLAQAFGALGHHVEVLAPGVLAEGMSSTVTTVGRSLRVPVNGSVAPMAPHPGAAARTVGRLRAGRFDVVHLHEPLAPSITVPALLCGAAPTVGTFHAAGDRTPYRWAAPVARWAARRLTVRVAVSEAAASLAGRYLGGSYLLVPNGVPPAAAPVTQGRTRERAVLFLGRHEPRKGLAVLLAAAAHLPDDVEVWVAGEGPQSGALRSAAPVGRHIRWLGRLSDDEKGERMARAQVLCAPSLGGESFGVVLAEAMAAGLPVVASDLSGYRAAVGEAAAVFVPPGDAVALADGLRRVLGDPALAERLRSAGAERARGLSMVATARRYVELSVLAAAGGGEERSDRVGTPRRRVVGG